MSGAVDGTVGSGRAGGVLLGVPRVPPPAPVTAPVGRPARRRRRRTALRLAGDTVVVLACWATGLVLLGVELDQATGPRVRGDAALVADVLLGVPATLALYARRRAPVVVASVLVAVSAVSVVAGVPSLVALFAVAARRRWPVVAAVAAGVVLAGTVYGLLWPEPGFPAWAVPLVGLVLVVPVAGWGAYVRTRHQLVASLREQAERARAEQEMRVRQARTTERSRIAREMHDVLAHRLSLVSMHAGALEFRPDADPADVARAAGVIRTGTHEALEDLRDILGVLRAEDVTGPAGEEARGRPQPTLDALPELAREARQAGGRVRLRVDVPARAQAPALIGRTAYRVVQEGLTNARKHAPGREVRVHVQGAPGHGLEVVVDDAGDASAPPSPPGAVPGAGLGLVGLAERVALAGGELEHGPAGDGFRLRARLPWPA
ncbi:sensor histidine kinase [Kineococcus arenarius]|uniref:sensor histidine kinase n=1 Tax=Kineococcus sp. SYSU DK007 TaxID=3383128 RepID=UPI003D7D7F08